MSVRVQGMQAKWLPQLLLLEQELQTTPMGGNFVNSLKLDNSLAIVSAGDRLQAYLLARAMGPEWELLSLAVAPDCQRQGMARAIHQVWQQMALDSGVEQLWLEVASNNPPAIKLYQQQGYQLQAIRKNYYPDADALLMTCSLR